MLRIIISVFILTSVLISASIDAYQFISPKPGSEYNTRESTIIIRWGEKIEQNTLLSDFISVIGSKSGKISGNLILSTDEKTIIFKPDAKFEPGETVIVKVLKGIQTTSGEILAETNFEFKITPLLEQPHPYKYIDELKNIYYPTRVRAF